MNGKLERAGAEWRLRFVRRLAHSPEAVWQAITDREQRRAWFPDEAIGDFTVVGAPLRFVHPGGEFDGEVLACEPPALLELRWGTDVIRLEIARDGDGSVLTLIDTFGEVGKAARDAAGWHECLDNLGHALDGTTPAAPGERWREVHPAYVAELGPGASTIGPPAEQADRQSG
jgi:uncharacterized protein YndB with AHSA1/START domain